MNINIKNTTEMQDREEDGEDCTILAFEDLRNTD
jgi:hypothetical protein